ncbi:MAG: YihY/virulence factor BrkB family protein [Eubacteriales bacterium]|nr:YihY/virulence factor BrkB family protein [Eubacteriales bacterium]
MIIILNIIKQLKEPYYQGFAAIIAFYLLLSIVPIIIILSQILGMFSVSLDLFTNLIDQYVQGEAATIFKGLFKHTPHGAVNIALIALALWAASRAQFAMMRIANYTITDGRSTGNGYFRERFRAMKTMIFTIFTFTFALLILVYGEFILKMLVFALMNSTDYSVHINQLWLMIRWPIAFLLYFLMVSYNYYVLPSWRVPFRAILPGSLFAAIGMLLVTWIFNIYMDQNLSNYNLIYGSLGSITALMLWFYLIAWALGLGIIFNKVWRGQHKNKPISR